MADPPTGNESVENTCFIEHIIRLLVQVDPPLNIQLCALTLKGDFVNHVLPDLDTARTFGNTSVHHGDWRTWDAFDLTERFTTGRRLVASYGSEGEENASSLLRRIESDRSQGVFSDTRTLRRLPILQHL